MCSNDPLEARLRILADMQSIVEDEEDELNALLAEYETELDLETLTQFAAAGPPRMSFDKWKKYLENADEDEA